MQSPTDARPSFVMVFPQEWTRDEVDFFIRTWEIVTLQERARSAVLN